MLFILRLTNGDCIVLLAPDEQTARSSASQLDILQGESVVSVRRLDGFEVRLSPTEDGSLEVASWNDAALDSILANEYPVLFDAYRRANAQPFARPNEQQPSLQHLKAEFERNKEIIRQALDQEIRRFASEPSEIPAPLEGTQRLRRSQGSTTGRSK